jgi:hypothetical protein
MSVEWQLKDKWQESGAYSALQGLSQDRLTQPGDPIREALRPMGGQ